MEQTPIFSTPEGQPEMTFLERALRYEAILDDAHKVAVHIADKEFRTEEAAVAARDILVRGVNERLLAIGGAEDIGIRLSGEHTFVPNATIISEPGSEDRATEISIRFDIDGRLRPLDAFESVEARFSEMGGVVSARENGTYKLNPYVLSELQAQTASITTSDRDGGYPLIKSVIFRYALTYLTDETGIEVEQLRQGRERQAELAEVERAGLIRGKLRQQLSRLTQALHHEVVYDYITLEKVDIIHKLGRIGTEQIKGNSERSTMVAKAILHSIKKERALRILYTDPTRENLGMRSVAGNLVDVLMPLSEDDSMPPSLVLDGTSDEQPGVQALYQVEFDSIRSVRF